jgi:excisionase family DNA binding protein
MSIYQDKADPELRLLLSAKQTAQRLNISERHLYNLTKQGQIECVRTGRRMKRYTPDGIQRYIARHTHGPESGDP